MTTTVAMAAANSTAAGLPREVLKWVQSLDLSYSIKNVRRAFNNGFLVAEIFSRYFPSDISMHSFENTENYGKKRDNWQQLQVFFYRRKIPIVISSLDALILNEQDTTLEFVKQIYSLLTERQLMPPIKLYENQQNDGTTNHQNNKDLLGLANEEVELEKEAAMENEKSLMGQGPGLSASKSPHKSLAIKGPPKVINETLEIDNYQGVKVTDINVRPVVQSVAQLRAQKEMSTIHSQAKLDSMSQQDGGLSSADRQNIHNSNSQHFGISQGGSPNATDNYLGGALHDGLANGAGNKIRHKTIADILQEKITAYVSRTQGLSAESSQQTNQQEFSQLKIENDMVNTFFDEIHKMSDQFSFNFIEELKQDMDTLVATLFTSGTELVTFYTFMILMIRRLSPICGSFTNTLLFCKQLAQRINTEQGSPASEFNKFFLKHLFKNYCAVIRECPNKRQHVCELLFAHCAHDLQLRIKVVQNLKKHLLDDELVYACQAYILAQETEFNEQWFDVFLYYALIGLSSQRTNIRVYSLNILNSIAEHNPDSMLEVAERVSRLAEEQFWEVKAQCLEFATTLLTKFATMSHLLAQKDDIKSGIGQPLKVNAPGGSSPSNLPMSGIPGSGAPGGADRNAVKNALQSSIDIVKKVFSVNAPKSVQKLGLFKLQPLLNDYKLLYGIYVDVLVQIDQEIKQIILSEEPIRTGEEIYFSLGTVSFNYKLKSDLANFDFILLANSLIELVINQKFESLEKEHMQIISVACGNKNELEGSVNTDSWLKVFQKLKDYLLVSICDEELCEEALVILHNFLTADVLRYHIQSESKDTFVKSVELLYSGDSQLCRDKFKEYLESQVVTRTVDTDNALKKFFKSVFVKLQTDHSAIFASSNLNEILDQLN